MGTRPACLLIRAIHGSVGDGELGESNPQDPSDPIRKIVKRSLKFARASERERERERGGVVIYHALHRAMAVSSCLIPIAQQLGLRPAFFFLQACSCKPTKVCHRWDEAMQ